MVVRGVKRSAGEYNGVKYDNIMIHCDCQNDGTMLCGDPVDVLKIKTPVFYNELSRLGCGDPSDLVGLDIRPRYNRYGSVDGFDL